MSEGRCPCCGMPFLWKSKHADAGRRYCDDCRSHYEILGESDERRDERLRVDRKRVAEYADELRALLNRNAAQLKAQQEKVRSALGSRDFWQAQVEEVLEVHSTNLRGGCSCGQRPCRTIEAIERGRRQGSAGIERF